MFLIPYKLNTVDVSVGIDSAVVVRLTGTPQGSKNCFQVNSCALIMLNYARLLITYGSTG